MTPTATPEAVSLVRVILAFVVVLGLMAALGLVLRYVSTRGIKLPGTGGAKRRLQLVETLPLDARRRLVIVRCDGREHLLLLGSNQDVVVADNLAEEPEEAVS